MNRRQFLRTASVVATPSIAGCTGYDAPDSAGDGSDEPDDDSSNWADTYPLGHGGLREYNPEFTDAEVEIGEPVDLPEYYEPLPVVRIWNEAGFSAFDLEFTDAASESVVLDETYEIPQDGELVVTVQEPSAYVYDVTVPEAGRSKTHGLSCLSFDCNEVIVEIGLFETGIVSSGSTTVVGCQSYCAEHPDLPREHPFGNYSHAED